MAIILKTSFGLCSKKSEYADLNDEKKALYDYACQYFDTTLLIDPQKVLYFFERGAQRPRLLYQNRDIADLTVLLIRSTRGREVSSAMLAHTLALCGCDIVDPLERFSIGFASKLLTTISRFERGVGSNSYIAFGAHNAKQLLLHLEISAQTPLLYKPATGKKGEGIVVFYQREEALAFVGQAASDLEEPESAFLFQTMENFIAEYRVVVMDGQALGVVQKHRAEDSVAANAAQGGVFVAVDAPEISAFVCEHVSGQGLLGVDVAVDDEGALHLIETNRAPMWTSFEKATGIEVAKEIILKIKNKLH